METPTRFRLSESMKTLFGVTVLNVFEQQQWHVEKHLLRLRLADPMTIHILPTVPLIPIEAFQLAEIEHRCILL